MIMAKNKVQRNIPFNYKNKKRTKIKNENSITKFILIGLIFILSLIFIVGILISKNQKLSFSNVYVSSDKSEILSVPLSNEEQKKVLTIVDKDTPIPKDYKLDLKKVNNIECDEILVNDLNNMMAKASRDGINLTLTKGYVDSFEQDAVYNKKVSSIMDEKLYTKVRAGVEAKKSVSPGGYSEYQTGLLLNFKMDNAKDQSLTKEFTWLNKNSIDYGFVVRYSKDKEKITGMNFDPSCFRYVGKENAKRMRAMNMCLEEYVNYIESQSFNLA